MSDSQTSKKGNKGTLMLANLALEAWPEDELAEDVASELIACAAQIAGLREQLKIAVDALKQEHTGSGQRFQAGCPQCEALREIENFRPETEAKDA